MKLITRHKPSIKGPGFLCFSVTKHEKMEDLSQPQPKLQAVHDIATDVDGRRSRIMAKFRDALLSKLAVSNPSISINSDHGSLIDRQVQEIFKSFHTPTHPPYALVIQNQSVFVCACMCMCVCVYSVVPYCPIYEPLCVCCF